MSLEHDPEKWKPVFPRDKREAFARRSCSNKKISPGSDSTQLNQTLAHAAMSGLSHHQYIEDDHRRQAQDHRPDADRPKNVFGGEALLFRQWIIMDIHDAPAFLAFVGPLIRVEF
jgi:hypothetical protein